MPVPDMEEGERNRKRERERVEEEVEMVQVGDVTAQLTGRTLTGIITSRVS